MIATFVIMTGQEVFKRIPYATKSTHPIILTIRSVFISFIKNEISTDAQAIYPTISVVENNSAIKICIGIQVRLSVYEFIFLQYYTFNSLFSPIRRKAFARATCIN